MSIAKLRLLIAQIFEHRASQNLCLQLLFRLLLCTRSRPLNVRRQILQRPLRRTTLAALIDDNPRHLNGSNDKQAEVDCRQAVDVWSVLVFSRMSVELHVQHILRSNHKAPPRPDAPRRHQCHILCQGQLLSRSEEVGCAGQHDAPFHHRCPEESVSACLSWIPPLRILAYQKCTVFTPTGLFHSF